MNQKDIVTLNNAKLAFLCHTGFPAQVGALYVNIHHHSAIVLEIEGKYCMDKNDLKIISLP